MKTEVHQHFEYATGYLELKMFDEAVKEVDAALRLAPDNHEALALKSAALWQANRLQEAEPFIAQLAELHPREAGIWINLAYIRRRTQSLAAAVETLQHAFDANPQDPLAYFNMACYRAVQNRPGEALELLKNAFQLDPHLRALAKAEHDLDSIRYLPEFHALLKRDDSYR